MLKNKPVATMSSDMGSVPDPKNRHQFLARDSIYAIACYMLSSMHLSVCHTGGSVKDG